MQNAQIVEKVQEIVGHHTSPDFVTGFEVRLGEFDGDPALWVVFQVMPGPVRITPELERRVSEMRDLQDAIFPRLLEAFDNRYPYFRIEADPRLKSAVA